MLFFFDIKRTLVTNVSKLNFDYIQKNPYISDNCRKMLDFSLS